MKSIVFHTMSYPGLPKDFHQHYKSVWVDIPPSLCDPKLVNRLYNESLDTLELAAELGFDAVGVNEHHGNGYGLMSSPNMMAAALARRTKNVAIMVMGDSIPLYNPPIRVAEELAQLDVLSGGRVIAGFPAGSSQDANFVYGIVPDTQRARYREGYDLVRQAWAADEVFTFNGRFTKIRKVNCWPHPMQKNGPPVWIPSSGSVETFDFAAQQDAAFCMLSFFGVDFARESLARFWDRIELAGLDDNPYRAGVTQFIGIADTDEEAEKIYMPHLRYHAQNTMHMYPAYVEGPGYKTVKSLESMLPPPGLQGSARKDSWGYAKDRPWKEFVEAGIIIAGSPATVRERLIDAGRKGRIGNWLLIPHFGDMPGEVSANNVRLYAEHVLPAISKEWGGYEHRWWPENATRNVSEPAAAAGGLA